VVHLLFRSSACFTLPTSARVDLSWFQHIRDFSKSFIVYSLGPGIQDLLAVVLNPRVLPTVSSFRSFFLGVMQGFWALLLTRVLQPGKHKGAYFGLLLFLATGFICGQLVETTSNRVNARRIECGRIMDKKKETHILECRNEYDDSSPNPPCR
ncbi:25210_t:CDS:2, partial [Dentiscutata erythropus]